MRFFSVFIGLVALFGLSTKAQVLPTGVTTVPFYDTSKAGLSFFKDRLSTSGMWEVPGKPQHFVVLGYFGYLWTLYPDTTRPDTLMPYGPIKRYTRTQVADFSNWVMKGWEQGSLGGAFDPNFSQNRYFYVLYEKYGSPAQYHAGHSPNGADVTTNPNHLTILDRYVMSADYRSMIRDTTLLTINHSHGFGVSNMVFDRNGFLNISTSSYDTNSWDSTSFMRKFLRIDVSRRDPGKLYSIPPSNPWYNVSNPRVVKESWAFGIRNAWSLSSDYLTGSLWAAEVGENEWEELNLVLPGRNYGWGDGGGQSTTTTDGSGVQGPCSDNTASGIAFRGSYRNPYSYVGPFSFGQTMTCANFTNGTWNFRHTGTNAVVGATTIPTSLPGTPMNCIAVSPAFRGSPASPFYGYHFITDVQRNYFLAVKEGIALPQNVGMLDIGGPITTNNPSQHDGIVHFPEDSYGNLYAVLVSSNSAGGATNWHDIYRLDHPQLIPLSTPRNQVTPTPILSGAHSATGHPALMMRVLSGQFFHRFPRVIPK